MARPIVSRIFAARLAAWTFNNRGYHWLLAIALAVMICTPQPYGQQPPDVPALVAPSDGASNIGTSVQLVVAASDPDGGNLIVTFYGHALKGSPGSDFTIAVLPDTQFYTALKNGGTPAIFNSQTQWIVNNLTAANLVYVVHEGDITEDGATIASEWENADTALSLLEVAPGIAYGLAVGNHDQVGGTTLFNQYFGTGRFTGRSYYGGHYGTTNNNHYDLFSSGGQDFIVVYLEYGASGNAAVMSWANNLLQTYSSRRAIVVNHDLLSAAGNPATYSSEGLAIYNALKSNLNLSLMLCGHASGEGQRTDIYNGNTVYTLLADYQNRTNGGNGWMRLLRFSPANNIVHVTTYSPWLNQSETDANSQFDLPMPAGPPFTPIGTATIASGSYATMPWAGLNASTSYEWYATVSDGTSTTRGATWSFATSSTNRAPTAVSQAVVTNEDTAKAITLAGSDPDGDPLTYAVVTSPLHGSLSGTAPNLNYMPGLNYNGTDGFTFTVNDGKLASSPAPISITVNPVNDPPVASNRTVTTSPGKAVSGQLAATDVDSPTLTFRIVTQPKKGTLTSFTPSSGAFTYRPNGMGKGADGFTFQAFDGSLYSNIAKITITIR